MKYFSLVILCFCLGCSHTASSRQSSEAPSLKKKDILIVGHRGASGYLPEHTLESYALAISMGADFIEPDLVMTKDKVLIVRHENEISETTDVSIKFPNRKKTKKIDGRNVTGWFVEDFTLKEIKTLRAKERLPDRDQSNNGKFGIPTFAEVLHLAKTKSLESGKTVGVYAETKHPSYFKSIGLPLENNVASELKKVGWTQAEAPVILQSFELSSLRKLKSLVNCRLVFLYSNANTQAYDDVLDKNSKTYGDYMKPEELKKLAAIVYGIGPNKRLILPVDEHGNFLPATSLIADAHKEGLKVHPYTFRSDAAFLAAPYQGDPQKEYLQFFELGVDGLFSDFTDHAVQARQKWLSE